MKNSLLSLILLMSFSSAFTQNYYWNCLALDVDLLQNRIVVLGRRTGMLALGDFEGTHFIGSGVVVEKLDIVCIENVEWDLPIGDIGARRARSVG